MNKKNLNKKNIKKKKFKKSIVNKEIVRANKSLLIAEIAKQAKSTYAEIQEFYNCLEVTLHDLLKKYHEIHLGINIGSLYLAERAAQPARKGINLQAWKAGKKVVTIIKAQPRRTVVRFKPANFLKAEIKNITD
ncbi:HU family DNA-binding protein [Candidatus Phytoplasma prunorum]|uniref:HU family DNA-binding protein n=1 Tax=Candidatus Phytoplasma prunorum TaxID=47565 RepID=UPI002FF1E500